MENTSLPIKMENIISWEEKIFSLKAWREKPLSTWVSLIVFWIIWSIFIWVFAFMFLGSMINTETVIVNWITKAPEDVDFTFVIAVVWAFSLVWIWMIIYGIYGIMKKWWYFVWTQSRLVYYNKQELKSVAWDEFTKNLQVKWTNVILELKSWFIVNSSDGRTERFVHHMMYISSIPNAIEIWEIIRKQIDKASNITETNNIS